MKRGILKAALCIVPAAVLVACGGGESTDATPLGMKTALGGNTSTTKTAQGIWVDIQAAGDLSIQQTEIYEYNASAAQVLVTNTLTSGPEINCAGKSCGTLADPNAPATAPSPDASKTTAFVTDGGNASFKCSLLDGSPVTGTTYTQSITTPKLGSRDATATYTYTWTYTILPTQSSYDARTAWDLVQTNGDGAANVSVGADVAGQSVLVKGGVYKYSFSLLDDAGANRVTDLKLAVLSAADSLEIASGLTDSVPVSNAPGAKPGDPGAVDFLYVSHNGGSNGDTALLKTGRQARDILNTDGFTGNDDGGADGKALAKAVVTPLTFQLGTGQYLLQLTGTVKGNSALAQSTSFQVQKTLNIVGRSCGSSNP